MALPNYEQTEITNNAISELRNNVRAELGNYVTMQHRSKGTIEIWKAGNACHSQPHR